MEAAICTFPPLSGFTKPLNGCREEGRKSPYFPICLSGRRELGHITLPARPESRGWTNAPAEASCFLSLLIFRQQFPLSDEDGMRSTRVSSPAFCLLQFSQCCLNRRVWVKSAFYDVTVGADQSPRLMPIPTVRCFLYVES